MVMVPSAGETRRLLLQTSLTEGLSLRVKNWLREVYWPSSYSHSDLLQPVAAENTHSMTNCTGCGNWVAASQPHPLEREARGSREYRRRAGEALAEAGQGGPLSRPGDRRQERRRRVEVARTTPS